MREWLISIAGEYTRTGAEAAVIAVELIAERQVRRITAEEETKSKAVAAKRNRSINQTAIEIVLIFRSFPTELEH